MPFDGLPLHISKSATKPTEKRSRWRDILHQLLFLEAPIKPPSPAALAILVRARDMITSRENWFQGAYYRRAGGVPTWCSVGALRDASDSLSAATKADCQEAYSILREIIWGKWKITSIEKFNDRVTHASVLEAFDMAIQRTVVLSDV